jgi:hypothetical protein
MIRKLIFAVVATLSTFFSVPLFAQGFSYGAPPQQSVIREYREVRPYAGVYCSQDNPPHSFAEYDFVAMDLQLMTVGTIQKCTNLLPKEFKTRQEAAIASYVMMEEFRTANHEGLVCVFTKAQMGLPRYSITFISPQLLKQERIDDCFKKAFDSTNKAFKSPTNSNGQNSGDPSI